MIDSECPRKRPVDAVRAAPQHIQLFALTAGLFCYIERFSCLSGRFTVIRGAFCHFERGEKSGQQIPPVAVLPRKDSLFAGAPRKNKQGGAACPVLLCRSLVSRRTGSAGGAVPACARGAASVYPGTLQMASGHSAGAVPQGGRPAGYAAQAPRRGAGPPSAALPSHAPPPFREHASDPSVAIQGRGDRACSGLEGIFRRQSALLKGHPAGRIIVLCRCNGHHPGLQLQILER